ncbi:hypothetical protein NMG60_11006591 [Bertholletia excelsa]
MAMVVVECVFVWQNTLFKAASSKGMSYYVYIVYSFAVATILLLPSAFLSYRNTMLPPPETSVLCKIMALGGIGFLGQILGNKGLGYGSPTLASVMSNLSPAFIFILAVIFRMEKYRPKARAAMLRSQAPWYPLQAPSQWFSTRVHHSSALHHHRPMRLSKPQYFCEQIRIGSSPGSSLQAAGFSSQFGTFFWHIL